MTDKLYTIVPEADEGKRVLSHSIEPFLRGVIELHEEGYTIKEGEVFSSMAGYQAYFAAPSEPVEEALASFEENLDLFVTEDKGINSVEGESEEATAGVATKIEGVINMSIDGAESSTEAAQAVFDPILVKAMGKDRTALDEYGASLGVKLNRSKKFSNMLADLMKALEV